MAKTSSKRKPHAQRVRPASCPCGSGNAYPQCCQPLHDGASSARDAEQLVRSRFSAYALGQVTYLWQTLHSGHDDRALGQQAFEERVKRTLSGCRYRALRILDRREPDDEGMACVLYSAAISQLNRDMSFVEQAYFVEEDGQWRYIAGTARPRTELSHALQEMAIDHWQCDHHHHH